MLLSHHAAGGEPEDGFAARKALSPLGVGRYGFCRTGVVMDWSNKSDEIYFRHLQYDKTCHCVRCTQKRSLCFFTTKKKNWRYIRLFILLAPRINPVSNQSQSLCSAVLLSHHAEGGEPEDGFAARKALSQIGVGRFAG